MGKIGIRCKIAGAVVDGKFHAINFPLIIIERGIDYGLAELTLVDQVPDYLVEAINAGIQRRVEFLAYPYVEIVGPFRLNW